MSTLANGWCDFSNQIRSVIKPFSLLALAFVSPILSNLVPYLNFLIFEMDSTNFELSIDLIEEIGFVPTIGKRKE